MDRKHISVSEITTYIQCSLKHKFRYIDQLEEEQTSDNLVLGQAIHDTLLLVLQQQRRGATLSEEEAQQFFKELWTTRVSMTPNLLYGAKNSSDILLEKGRKMVAAYVQNAPKEKVIAIEKRFLCRIPHPKKGYLDVPLKGFLDLLVDRGGDVPEVIEIKTSASRYSEQKLITDLQATAYTLAACMKFGVAPEDAKFEFQVLVKTKEPKFVRYTVKRTGQDIMRFGLLVEKVLEAMESNVAFPNESSWMCSTCDHAQACTLWSMTKEKKRDLSYV